MTHGWNARHPWLTPALADSHLPLAVDHPARLVVDRSGSFREASDLAVILLGRLLHIEETRERGPEIEEEIRRIVKIDRQVFTRTGSAQRELRGTLLDIPRYLPARTGTEIAFVRMQAENARTPEIQDAFIQALSHARPFKDDAATLAALQAAAGSAKPKIAEAARGAMRGIIKEAQT